MIGTLDLIIDTVSAKHDFTPYFSESLTLGGTMVLVGVSPEPNSFGAFGLIGGRKVLTGSLIGGIERNSRDARLLCEEKSLLGYRTNFDGQDQRRVRTHGGG